MMKTVDLNDVDLEIIEKLVNIEIQSREEDNEEYGFDFVTEPLYSLLEKVRKV